MEFFIKHGLDITDKALEDCIMTLIKVSKYTTNDPPVEILDLLIKSGANVNYMDKVKLR